MIDQQTEFVTVGSIPPAALNRPDAARYCSVSVTSIDRAVAAGELRKAKIGTHTVFRVEDLDAWLLSKVVPTGSYEEVA